MIRKKIGWCILVCSILLELFSLAPNSAYAQDKNGDYFQSTLPSDPDSGPDYVNSYWLVITPSGLNCRRNAGTEFDIVKILTAYEDFYVQTSIGRDQHNNPIELDSRGLPWFKVADFSQGSVKCFIRANSRYIEPILN